MNKKQEAYNYMAHKVAGEMQRHVDIWTTNMVINTTI